MLPYVGDTALSMPTLLLLHQPLHSYSPAVPFGWSTKKLRQ
jgi:hypothetical protein